MVMDKETYLFAKSELDQEIELMVKNIKKTEKTLEKQQSELIHLSNQSYELYKEYRRLNDE
jgi:hypothetical protein